MEELDGFDELQEFTLTLVGDHIALAVDLLLDSRQFSETPWMWRYSHRRAMSSILHAFLGLESAINLIGYELFFDPSSPRYIMPADRSIPVKLMVDRWSNGLSWSVKLDYILSAYNYSIDEHLKQELLECATIRNLIAHGNPYKQRILLGKDLLSVRVVDREIIFDSSKFSHTKLKSPSFIEYHDAYTVNRIILNTLKVLAIHTGNQFMISPTDDKDNETIRIDDDFDVSEILDHGFSSGSF